MGRNALLQAARKRGDWFDGITSTPARRDATYEQGRTALLLVDMQRVWLEPGLGTTHGKWTAPEEYFYRETANRVIPNQTRLLAAARRAGIEVIHTIVRSLTQDGRDRSLDHKLTPIHLPPDAPEALPVAELETAQR